MADQDRSRSTRSPRRSASGRRTAGTDAAAGMSAVTSVIRAQQLMMARIDAALKPFGLSFARYEMLRLLAFTREGRMPMASAIARLQVHPTSVTNTVDRLVRDGLVVREPHPADGRAAILVLTETGASSSSAATDALNAEVFAEPGLTEDDTVELVAILAAGATPATSPTRGRCPTAVTATRTPRSPAGGSHLRRRQRFGSRGRASRGRPPSLPSGRRCRTAPRRRAARTAGPRRASSPARRRARAFAAYTDGSDFDGDRVGDLARPRRAGRRPGRRARRVRRARPPSASIMRPVSTSSAAL